MGNDYSSVNIAEDYPDETKTPAEVRDFMLFWARELDGSTIVTSEWDVDSLVEVSDSFTDSRSTVRVAGGDDGRNYDLQNTITGSDGQVFSKRLVLAVNGDKPEIVDETPPPIDPPDSAPYLLSEDGAILITEDGNRIILE